MIFNDSSSLVGLRGFWGMGQGVHYWLLSIDLPPPSAMVFGDWLKGGRVLGFWGKGQGVHCWWLSIEVAPSPLPPPPVICFLGYRSIVGLKRFWLKGVRRVWVLYQYSILNSQELVILKNPLQIFHVSHLPEFWPGLKILKYRWANYWLLVSSIWQRKIV